MANASFALAQSFYFSALVVQPSSYRPLFIVPVALATVYFFQSALQYRTPLEYTYACGALAQIFVASSYILLTDVQRKLFIKGQKKPAHQLPLLERVKWAAKLYTSSRGTRWSHEPTHALPPHPSPSITRSKFLLQEIRTLVWEIVLYEAIVTYAKSSPSFAVNGHSIGEDDMFWRIVNVLGVGFGAIVAIRMVHRMLCIPCVAIGFSEPQDCVPIFGDFRDAYTLRNFWGHVWHQLLRWVGVSHGRFLAYDVFRLKRGSKAAYMVQLYTTFAITAVIHVAGEYSLLGYLTYRHALLFFLLQPVAITFETLVIGVIGKLSIRGPWRLIGHIWVLMWFVYTVPNWIDPLLQRGLAEAAPSFGLLSFYLRAQT
ncbi:hypothetical protein APHAL10511_006956 [Amanita phalloides]|nr:hypothetical protein APHAL10511_006956 [Amanita phalloides]